MVMTHVPQPCHWGVVSSATPHLPQEEVKKGENRDQRNGNGTLAVIDYLFGSLLNVMSFLCHLLLWLQGFT